MDFTSYGSFKLETKQVILFLNFQCVYDSQESGAGGLRADEMKQGRMEHF